MPTIETAEEVTYSLTPAGLAALDAQQAENHATKHGDASEGISAAAETFPPEADASAPAVSEGFVPDTADKVDWVLSKIADHRARAARIRENAELMAKEADREAEGLLWQFGPSLQDFARRELAGGKKKSIRFFHGVIGYRTKPAALTITNEPEARAWAEANLPSALRVDSRALAAHLLDTGEVIDGAQLVPAEETFYVK